MLNTSKLSAASLPLGMAHREQQALPPGRPLHADPSLASLLTVPVVADGEFLAPGAIADPVEVRPHGGREEPLQIVRIWQENSSVQWPQTCVPKTQDPLWSPPSPLTSILSHLWRGERDEGIHIVLIHDREQGPAHQTSWRQNATLG